jgi:hypothetical protein
MGEAVKIKRPGNAGQSEAKSSATKSAALPATADSKSFENAALDISLANLNMSELSPELSQLAKEKSAQVATAEAAIALMQGLLQKVDEASSTVHSRSGFGTPGTTLESLPEYANSAEVRCGYGLLASLQMQYDPGYSPSFPYSMFYSARPPVLSATVRDIEPGRHMRIADLVLSSPGGLKFDQKGSAEFLARTSAWVEGVVSLLQDQFGQKSEQPDYESLDEGFGPSFVKAVALLLNAPRLEAVCPAAHKSKQDEATKAHLEMISQVVAQARESFIQLVKGVEERLTDVDRQISSVDVDSEKSKYLKSLDAQIAERTELLKAHDKQIKSKEDSLKSLQAAIAGATPKTDKLKITAMIFKTLEARIPSHDLGSNYCTGYSSVTVAHKMAWAEQVAKLFETGKINPKPEDVVEVINIILNIGWMRTKVKDMGAGVGVDKVKFDYLSINRPDGVSVVRIVERLFPFLAGEGLEPTKKLLAAMKSSDKPVLIKDIAAAIESLCKK